MFIVRYSTQDYLVTSHFAASVDNFHGHAGGANKCFYFVSQGRQASVVHFREPGTLFQIRSCSHGLWQSRILLTKIMRS